jgi:molybdopterin molybdotransferase
MMGSHAHDGASDKSQDMIPVEDARKRVLSEVSALAPLELVLNEAYGCVAAGDIVADHSLPEFASSAMDGFAIRASDTAGASRSSPTELKIVGRALIGHMPEATVGGGEAVRIATGAPIPSGADSIVPIENVDVDGEVVRVFEGPAPGVHVRPAGEDVREGQVLVAAGKRLGPPELGLLANAGHPHPLVHPRPRVVVMSTGDELIAPTGSTGFGQVRDTNSSILYGALREVGAIPVMAGIVADDVEALKEVVSSYLIQADAFISSGGVSAGERDVVKAAFLGQGEIDFYKVAMQPGMPQAFGHVDGKPFFGLPGNPVSVFVSFEIFVRPALLKMMGRTQLFRPEILATLDAEVSGPPSKTQFARVEVRRTPEGWIATPTGPRGSNLVSTVARANGLAIMPPEIETAPAGSQVRVMLFRAAED